MAVVKRPPLRPARWFREGTIIRVKGFYWKSVQRSDLRVWIEEKSYGEFEGLVD